MVMILPDITTGIIERLKINEEVIKIRERAFLRRLFKAPAIGSINAPTIGIKIADNSKV